MPTAHLARLCTPDRGSSLRCVPPALARVRVEGARRPCCGSPRTDEWRAHRHAPATQTAAGRPAGGVRVELDVNTAPSTRGLDAGTTGGGCGAGHLPLARAA